MPNVFDCEVQRSANGGAFGATFKFTILAGIPQGVLEEALRVRGAIETTNRDIVIVLHRLRAIEAYEAYLARLEEAISAGLGSELPDFSIAWSLVNQIRDDFVKIHGEQLRSAYIRHLTQIVGSIGVPALLYGSVVSPWSTLWWPSALHGNIEAQVRATAWVICGVCVSVWLSFVVRTRRLEWNMLTSLDLDGLLPITRIGLVLAGTYVFVILRKLGGISIVIGSLELLQFIQHPSIAILVGLTGCLGGDALADIVVGRVRGLTSSRCPGELICGSASRGCSNTSTVSSANLRAEVKYHTPCAPSVCTLLFFAY